MVTRRRSGSRCSGARAERRSAAGTGPCEASHGGFDELPGATCRGCGNGDNYHTRLHTFIDRRRRAAAPAAENGTADGDTEDRSVLLRLAEQLSRDVGSVAAATTSMTNIDHPATGADNEPEYEDDFE